MKYSVSENIIGCIVYFIKKILSILPINMRYVIFENIGMMGYFFIKKRRKITINNIKNAFPEKSEKEIINIAKESYKNIGRMIMVSMYLDEITTNKKYNISIENEDIFKNVHNNSEKSILLVSLHLGGFEAGSILRKYRKFYAVFRKQKNKRINEIMGESRKKGGLNPIPLHDSEMLNKVLLEKCTIALASDHKGSDVEVDFFGQRVGAVAGPIILSMKYKVPIVLGYVYFSGYKKRDITLHFVEHFNIEKKGKLRETAQYNMQKIYNNFEEIIKKYPDQYMWQNNRWKTRNKIKNKKGTN